MADERHTQQANTGQTNPAQSAEAGLDAAVAAAKQLIGLVGWGPVTTVRLQVGDAIVEIHSEPATAPGPWVPEDAAREDAAQATSAEGHENAQDANLVEVKAPAVGVFYRRPAPDDPPFAEEGGHVGEDDQIGLIEAMKTYTPVKIPRAGVVEEFRAEDKQVVEFEEVLATLRPDDMAPDGTASGDSAEE